MTRQTLSDSDCKAIRRFYFDQKQTGCFHRDVMAWFHCKFGRTISQPQVSKILKPEYAYLDTVTVERELQRKRHKQCERPILEKALSEWQILKQAQGVSLAGEHLRQQALVIWGRLPQYKTLPSAMLSPGWLGNFKQRHGIWGFVRHGEAG
jgi:hypothetical protein